MADKDQSVELDIASHMEKLEKAFLELEALDDANGENIRCLEVQEYFHQLEMMMMKKLEVFNSREKEFKEKISDTSKMIGEREAVVSAKEQESLDRIQELRDTSVKSIAEARRTHLPECSDDSKMLVEREGVVAAMEGELFDEILKLKDAGGGTISEAQQTHQAPNGGEDDKEMKVSSYNTDAVIDTSEEESRILTGEKLDEVKPRPELMQFCEQMDAKGLLNYMMENKRNLRDIRRELSVALKSASEPGRLVLASLEGFYTVIGTSHVVDKDDPDHKIMRRSCINFMQAMDDLLVRSYQGADHLLNPEIKQQAKAIADEWQPKLDATNASSLEVEAFLQLLATFRIASEFDNEELCKLVHAVAYQRRAPDLCRCLGLTHKMEGLIEALVNNGKYIEAVHFVHHFQLTETFPTVPLLRTYLREMRRNSQRKPGNSENTAGTQKDVNAQELAALKVVIQCVEEYKLHVDYPLDTLHKRVSQLECTKTDRKRSGRFGKEKQRKKPRVDGRVNGSRLPGVSPLSSARGGQGVPLFGQRAMYPEMTGRNLPPGPSTPYDFQAPSQSTYQPTYAQSSYYHPPEERVNTLAYSTTPATYGSYMDQPPSHQYM